jgi:predicted RNA-binding protein with PUA-like domain
MSLGIEIGPGKNLQDQTVMAYWLFKEEPSHYSYADLEKDGKTVWSGVANALAQRHLRSGKKKDLAFYYHTGDEKAIVGVVEIAGDPFPDPEADDEKLVAVEVKPLRRLPRPVTLAEIKADSAFADWELVRMSRLSVMPVSAENWKRIETMSKDPSPSPSPKRRGE